MNKRELRKTLRRVINESKWEEKRDHSKLGYGSGAIVADMSDEIMLIIQHCLENGMTEEEVKFRGNNAIEAAILEFKRGHR